MGPSVKVMLFISIGGVVSFLPLIFIKREKVTVKNISLIFGFIFAFSVFLSGVVAIGGNCGFLETLLMTGSQCNFMPFVNARTIPVTNTLAFVFLVILVITLARDIVFYVNKKK